MEYTINSTDSVALLVIHTFACVPKLILFAIPANLEMFPCLVVIILLLGIQCHHTPSCLITSFLLNLCSHITTFHCWTPETVTQDFPTQRTANLQSLCEHLSQTDLNVSTMVGVYSTQSVLVQSKSSSQLMPLHTNANHPLINLLMIIQCYCICMTKREIVLLHTYIGVIILENATHIICT